MFCSLTSTSVPRRSLPRNSSPRTELLTKLLEDARVVQLVDTIASKAIARKGMRVRVPPRAPLPQLSPAPGTERSGNLPFGVLLSYTSRPMRIQKTLTDLGDRLTRARADLRILEEQILYQMDVLEEAKTRMLVSETPIADREYRIARDDYERMLRGRDEITKEIAELQQEQDRLLDRMLGSHA